MPLNQTFQDECWRNNCVSKYCTESIYAYDRFDNFHQVVYAFVFLVWDLVICEVYFVLVFWLVIWQWFLLSDVYLTVPYWYLLWLKCLEICVCCGWVQTVLLKCFTQFSGYSDFRNMKELQEIFEFCFNLVLIKAVCDKVFWTSKFHGMFTQRQQLFTNCFL